MSLYRVDTYSGTPAWTDISPAGGYEVERRYGLAVDPLNTDAVLIAADDGGGQHWFYSVDQGANWTDGGATSATMLAVKHAGDVILMAGGAALEYSETYGTSFEDKLGDWTPGTIRGFWVVL